MTIATADILSTTHVFASLIAMIPPRHYLPSHPDSAPLNPTYLKNKREAAPKQAIKEASRKAKRTKLDPTLPTFASTLVCLGGQEEGATTTAAAAQGLAQGVDAITLVTPLPASGTTAQLKEKVAARLASLKQGRQPIQQRTNPSSSSSSSTREEVPQKSRQDILEERTRKKQAERKKRKQLQQHSTGASLVGVDASKQQQHIKKHIQDVTGPSVGSIQFSKVEFGEDGVKTTTAASKKSGPTHVADQLAVLQAKKARLEALQAKDADKAAAIQTSDTWSKLERKAAGEKIRDDAGLLKKSVKRVEKAKAKSAREWSDRKQAKAQEVETRQKKRQENLLARKEGRGGKVTKHKTGGSKKSQSHKKGGRPGFEGAKR